MLVGFELYGAHQTLPVSEILACLESLNIDFKIYLSLDGCLILNLKKEPINLKKRLSMTHNIFKVLGIGDKHSYINVVKKSEINLKKKYKIRARAIKNYHNINSEAIERNVGKILYEKGARANLKNPEIEYRLLFTEDKCIFGYILESIDRSEFEKRKPHYKPFFYPGVMMPILAKALVNISMPKKNILDPFCGTGGILTEAGLIGYHVIGSDVQRKLLIGAKTNLEYYNVKYSLFYQDACNLCFKDETIDAVVTDPPYGRSALIKAESIEKLIFDSLKEIYRVLITEKRAVFVFDSDIQEIAKKIGFEIIEIHTQRVHRSLTRYIHILKKRT